MTSTRPGVFVSSLSRRAARRARRRRAELSLIVTVGMALLIMGVVMVLVLSTA
jgi:hypothetical protein